VKTGEKNTGTIAFRFRQVLLYFVLDYRAIHHLTHAAVARLVFYWAARLRYLLLTVFSFKSLSVQKLSYHQRFLYLRTLSV
jgi:hypothetical protein